MNGRYAVLAGRIRRDLAEIERIVQRAERAVLAAGADDPNRDLFEAFAVFLEGLAREA